MWPSNKCEYLGTYKPGTRQPRVFFFRRRARPMCLMVEKVIRATPKKKTKKEKVIRPGLEPGTRTSAPIRKSWKVKLQVPPRACLNTTSSTMYIPQDVVNLIIDQMVSMTAADPYLTASERCRCLQATSLVSTVWVNPSQRQLFSVVNFYWTTSLREWCSLIRPGPHGISRHVRVLRFWVPSLAPDILEFALPHLTSFQHLRELGMGQIRYGERRECIDINRISLDILVPISSSFAGTLRRLQWTQKAPAHETWETLDTLTNLFPNLIDIDLSRVDDHFSILPPTHPRICLPSDCQPPNPLAFTHFRFQELEVRDSILPSPRFSEYCKTHLRVLDIWTCDMEIDRQYRSVKRGLILTTLTEHRENLQMLFEACYALQELSFSFVLYIGWALGSIPSNSVTLIRLRDPEGVIGTTYNSCWGYPLEIFERWLEPLESEKIPEYERLGVSIREMAQRFSKHNCGLKTRVQVVYLPSWEEAQAIDNGEIPFFMTKLEEELGAYVTLELDLLPAVPDTES